MPRKRTAAQGVFQSAGKAVDDSVTMAEAIRTGTLTRAEFEAWYARRAAERAAIVVSLREKSTRLLQPLTAALERGRGVLTAAPPPRRPRRRPNTRASSNISARRK